MQFRGVFWFPMVLNDPCGPRYVTDTLGKGPGSLWEASGMPPQPPGEQAGGVRLGSFSAVFTFKAVIVINSTVASHKIHCFEIETDKRDSLALVVRAEEGCCQCCVTLYHTVSCVRLL